MRRIILIIVLASLCLGIFSEELFGWSDRIIAQVFFALSLIGSVILLVMGYIQKEVKSVWFIAPVLTTIISSVLLWLARYFRPGF